MTAAAPLPAPTADAVDASRWSVSMHRLRDRARLDAAIAFARDLHDHGIEPAGADLPNEFRTRDRTFWVRNVALGGMQINVFGPDRTDERKFGTIAIPKRRKTSLGDQAEDRRLALEHIRNVAGWLPVVLEAAATRPSSTHPTSPGETEDDPRKPHLARVGMAAALLSGRTDGRLRPVAPSPWADFEMRDDVWNLVEVSQEALDVVAGSIAPCACVDDDAPEGDPRFDFEIRPLHVHVHTFDPVEAMRIVSAHRSNRP